MATITYTAAAIAYITSIRPNDTALLRLYLEGGGCSSFEVSLGWESIPSRGDIISTAHGRTVIIDPMSYQHLSGTTIDYRNGYCIYILPH
jgi:iron-sulfur cluster insertion protein